MASLVMAAAKQLLKLATTNKHRGVHTGSYAHDCWSTSDTSIVASDLHTWHNTNLQTRNIPTFNSRSVTSQWPQEQALCSGTSPLQLPWTLLSWISLPWILLSWMPIVGNMTFEVRRKRETGWSDQLCSHVNWGNYALIKCLPIIVTFTQCAFLFRTQQQFHD